MTKYLIILLSFYFVVALSQEPIQLSHQNAIFLNQWENAVLLDSTGAISVHDMLNNEQLNWRANSSLNLDYKEEVVWLKVKLTNTEADNNFILSLKNARLDSVSLFIVKNNSVVQQATNGKRIHNFNIIPFTRHPEIRFQLNNEENAVLLARIKSKTNLFIPLKVESVKTRYNNAHHSNWIVFIILGSILSVLFISSFYYTIIRHHEFWIFSLILLFSILHALSFYGFGDSLNFWVKPSVKPLLTNIFLNIILALVPLLTRHYFTLDKYKFFHIIFSLLTTFFLFVSAWQLYNPDAVTSIEKIKYPSIVVSSLIHISTFTYLFRSKNKHLTPYITAVTFLTIATLFGYLTSYTITPHNVFLEFSLLFFYSLFAGSMLYALLKKYGSINSIKLQSEELSLKNHELEIEIDNREHIEKALKENKKKFEQLFQAMPVPIFIRENITGRVLDINNKVCELLNKSTRNIIGFKAIDLGLIEEKALESITNLLDKKEFITDVDVCLGNEDGLIKNFTLSAQKIMHEGSDCLLIALVDISQQKESQDKLQQLNATKDRFMSIIAHDLKSPFQTLIGLSESLAEAAEEDDHYSVKLFAQSINRASNQAFDLLNNLLTWSRTQTKKIVFQPTEVDLFECITVVANQFYDTLEKKGVALRIEDVESLMIFADENMLSTIFRNLIGNAIKFTPKGGTISLCAWKKDKTVTIAVSDTGVGISPENRQKLFRLDSNYTTRGTNNEKGTGLGLILCREFVEKHNGKIWVESAPGSGSSFYFTIPQQEKTPLPK